MEDKATHLDRHRCALLVVDIQERLMPVIDGRQRVIDNTVLLIKAAKTLALPIVASTQYAARIGPLVPEVAGELAGIEPCDKMEFDCFANEDLRARLKGLGRAVDTLILCGVECHICVYQTVVGAIAGGYRVWVAADAVSSRTAANCATGLARIAQLGGVIGSTEMIIYDLLGRAGTEEFRALLPFLK
ncbi:MAG: isochorismatase family protein [Thermodesulfobacteriota bacterium]